LASTIHGAGMMSFGTRQRRSMAVPANGRAIYTFACDRDSLPGSDQHLWTRNAMDSLLGAVAAVGHAIEQVLVYVESHHWIFGALAGGYIFYLHDRALHARFDALEKRIDEVRKRLAVEL
jgi:hypothetical protein